MSINIAKSIRSISESPTLAMDAKAKAMKLAGKNVINLSAGEPDFDTPAHVREAGVKAIEKGFTRYCPAAGIPELRTTVATVLKTEKGLEYDTACIAVTNGAKQAIYLALQTLLDPGDEVIIQTPYWVSYPDMVKSLGGVPVFVPAKYSDAGFVLNVNSFAKRLSARTKAVIVNTPNNPTGSVYTKDELSSLTDVLFSGTVAKTKNKKRSRGFLPCVISDEVYEKLTYEPRFRSHESSARAPSHAPQLDTPSAPARHVSIAALSKHARENTVVISGVSKTYAMTGWRIGYAAGPRPVIDAIVKLLGQTTSGCCSVSQHAALAALQGDQGVVETMRKTFDERRRYVIGRLRVMSGVVCPEPLGAFYAFLDIRAFVGARKTARKIASSAEFSRLLLEEKGVATVPGEAFGAPGFLRLSYAASMETVKAGLDRLEDFLGGIGRD